MFRYFPHIGEKVGTVHNVQQAEIVVGMGINVPRIYVALDNKQEEYQPHMIEVEGMINNQTIAILIDSEASHSYIDPNTVESFHLLRSNHEKYLLVQLATEAKIKVNEMVKSCLMDMNVLNTRENLNILPLGSCDCLIGMDWLDQHHDILDCHKKEFTCLDEEGNLRTMQGIPWAVTIRESLVLQLKKCYRKGFQISVAHMEETPKDRVSNIEDYAVLKDFEDVLRKYWDYPLKETLISP
jgi:hypothetical protein